MLDAHKQQGQGGYRKIIKGLRTLNQQMSSSDLNTLKQSLRKFAEARDWDQFHSPKNLSMALSAEVAEITGYIQWFTKEHIKEIADVLSSDGVWFNTKVLIAVGEK